MVRLSIAKWYRYLAVYRYEVTTVLGTQLIRAIRDNDSENSENSVRKAGETDTSESLVHNKKGLYRSEESQTETSLVSSPIFTVCIPAHFWAIGRSRDIFVPWSSPVGVLRNSICSSNGNNDNQVCKTVSETTSGWGKPTTISRMRLSTG